MDLHRNMRTGDRLIRALVVAPLAVVAAVWLGVGTIGGIALLVVAGIMLATSAVGFCPLYALVGRTVRRSRGVARRAG